MSTECRRTVNRGRRWAALVGLSLLTAPLQAALTSTPAHAVAAPVSVTQVQPVNPDSTSQLYVERVAPRYAGDAAGWRLNMDMRVANTSTTSNLTLTTVTVSYPGSSIGSQTSTVNKTMAKSGLSGSTLFLVVPDNRINAFPLPASVSVKLGFSGFDSKTVSRTLVEYVNKTPSGGYRFPASAVSGGHWKLGTGHDATSHHRGVQNQRFAYDLQIVKWNGSAYSTVKPGATKPYANTDYWTFGTPIYAMADGFIRKCRKDQPDNVPGVLSPEPEVEGNHLYIEHATGEVALYAHFKAGSLSSTLCPANAATGLNIFVQQGQFLGYSGNSGNSSGPHLHLHLADRVGFSDSAGTAQGLPLRFHHATARMQATPTSTPGFTALTNSSEAALRQGELINPNTCGWQRVVAGGTQWARHGVNNTCWQEEFNDTALAGYRLVWRQQAQDGSASRVASIWRPKGGLPWAARNGQTAAQYQASFTSYVDAGYRLTHVDSYLQDGAVRYSSVFTKTSGPAWTAYHGVSAATHQAKFNSLTAAGYRPRQISVVYVDGARQYTAMYEKVAVGGFVSLTNIAEADYQTVYNQQVAAGRRPVYLDTYLVGTSVRFSAIFTSGAPATVARHNLTSAQYQTEFNTQTAAGRLLVAVSAYRSGGVLKYAALWN
jgi:murein DD-endopeptidase MepM/ murein hydrolase activator NlpD